MAGIPRRVRVALVVCVGVAGLTWSGSAVAQTPAGPDLIVNGSFEVPDMFC